MPHEIQPKRGSVGRSDGSGRSLDQAAALEPCHDHVEHAVVVRLDEASGAPELCDRYDDRTRGELELVDVVDLPLLDGCGRVAIDLDREEGWRVVGHPGIGVDPAEIVNTHILGRELKSNHLLNLSTHTIHKTGRQIQSLLIAHLHEATRAVVDRSSHGKGFTFHEHEVCRVITTSDQQHPLRAREGSLLPAEILVVVALPRLHVLHEEDREDAEDDPDVPGLHTMDGHEPNTADHVGTIRQVREIAVAVVAEVGQRFLHHGFAFLEPDPRPKPLHDFLPIEHGKPPMLCTSPCAQGSDPLRTRPHNISQILILVNIAKTALSSCF